VHALHGSQSVGCVSSHREIEHITLKSRTQGQLKYSEVEDKTCIRTGLKSYSLYPKIKVATYKNSVNFSNTWWTCYLHEGMFRCFMYWDDEGKSGWW